MREDLDKRLCTEFPLLYRDRRGDPRATCMCWGFPGDGWFRILHELSSKLEPLITAQPDDQRSVAVQVKEKFGTLRFYMEGEDSRMLDLIQEAERQSASTCEMCGIQGRLREGGWLKTLCDWCAAKRDRRGVAMPAQRLRICDTAPGGKRTEGVAE
jgi:hypothetical protein